MRAGKRFLHSESAPPGLCELLLMCTDSVRAELGPEDALHRQSARSEYTWELEPVLPGVQSRPGI